jgi:hypothetical protein
LLAPRCPPLAVRAHRLLSAVLGCVVPVPVLLPIRLVGYGIAAGLTRRRCASRAGNSGNDLAIPDSVRLTAHVSFSRLLLAIGRLTRASGAKSSGHRCACQGPH